MSDKENQGKFIHIKTTSFEELISGKVTEMPESDLCFQNESSIVQFKYEKPEVEEKFIIEPGTYSLQETNVGVRPVKMELRKRDLLETIDNTSRIMKEAKTFFSRLHVYEEVNRPKKRATLLYSRPGLGKTSAITKLCHDFIKEDPGTVVFNWPTSDVGADAVNRFLSGASEYAKEATRLILIIEDIGGGERDDGCRDGVPSGLLNLLDGVDVVFKLPTFILATTNHPETLLESLADRPGRFDLMLELLPPTTDEKCALLEFLTKRKATDEERAALGQKGAENFSIAHIEEIVIRGKLHDKSVPEVVKEMIDHSKKYQRGFEKEKGGLGFGGRFND
jgi:SpoVK/Ycf46/Vps4 family AAA+-type ATPase